MEIETSTVKKLVISDVPGLDPITVFLEDLEPRKGKATITCYKESWTAYWGNMGDMTIAEFILSCNEHYLANNLAERVSHSVIDLDGLADDARKQVIKDRRAKDLDMDRARELFDMAENLENIEHESTISDVYGPTLQEIYGDDWWYGLPQIPNPEYTYICRVINTIKEALYRACVDKWRLWYDNASEDAKKWRRDAQDFYGALVKIAEYHGTKDEVWANNMRTIAKEALADRP